MKHIIRLIMQGLGAVLPLGLTLYALLWLIATLESVSRKVLLFVLPDYMYFPGLGLISGLGFLCAVGLLMHVWGMRYLVGLGDRLVQKIPLAKSIYASIKDISTVFNLGKKTDMKNVVRVDMGNNLYQLGFLTGEKAGKRLFPDEERIGVYLPMSYQIGGFTYYVTRDKIETVDIGVEEAMRLTLTGGAQSNQLSDNNVTPITSP